MPKDDSCRYETQEKGLDCLKMTLRFFAVEVDGNLSAYQSRLNKNLVNENVPVQDRYQENFVSVQDGLRWEGERR